jgi:asparagine synthase (glutamine-hydrolysing)
MCGITGIQVFSEATKHRLLAIEPAISSLKKRGPDDWGVYKDRLTAIGHRRLSIIDTSSAGHQPFSDPTGRYTIVFNGEFFNYSEHRNNLSSAGIHFISNSDTEVLLHLWIREQEKCLSKITGFYAFAVYDKKEQSLCLVRDRYGEKPLLYSLDSESISFASEMKSLLEFKPGKELDLVSLQIYLQLNYIPAPATIFKNVKKLEPGHLLRVRNGIAEISRYYELAPENISRQPDYKKASTEIRNLLENSVQERLVSDVPLGTFLSGGIDSTIVTALAARHQKDLKSFSIGFPDEPFFDETKFAQIAAKKIGTEHTVFALKNQELFDSLEEVLDYTDEPFADSSALLVYILSKKTKKSVTVALTGDGADELFSGYNKHAAEYRITHQNLSERLVAACGPLWKILPKSRNGPLGNLVRQLDKFSQGIRLSEKERYWKWAGFADANEASALLLNALDRSVYEDRKKKLTSQITADFNTILRSDFNLVLQNDMLVKTDLMSMANGLELRSPFLDNKLVDYVFSLPEEFKIDRYSRKKILKDTFASELPPEIFARGKHGFEVPLLKWFQTELKSLIFEDLLSEQFLEEQGIFNMTEINLLKQKLMSADPGDTVGRIWALIVFQYWWKKYGREEKN